MSTEPFIGEVKIFGFNFPPKGYALCQGQLLPISQNTALFSLLGTTYGGNGTVTFALPDLQGRMAIGQGQGPGLPAHVMGETAGVPSVTLLTSNIPSHNHTLHSVHVQQQASTDNAVESSPDATFPAVTTAASYSDTPTANVYTGGAVVSGTTDIAGSNVPVDVMNPYLCINYSIAVMGIFPSRN